MTMTNKKGKTTLNTSSSEKKGRMNDEESMAKNRPRRNKGKMTIIEEDE